MPTTDNLTAADLFTAPELDQLQPSDLAGVTVQPWPDGQWLVSWSGLPLGPYPNHDLAIHYARGAVYRRQGQRLDRAARLDRGVYTPPPFDPVRWQEHKRDTEARRDHRRELALALFQRVYRAWTGASDADH